MVQYVIDSSPLVRILPPNAYYVLYCPREAKLSLVARHALHALGEKYRGMHQPQKSHTQTKNDYQKFALSRLPFIRHDALNAHEQHP